MIEFQGWPKIARLNRDITITEKIDGTNAAVGIQEFGPDDVLSASAQVYYPLVDGQRYVIYAQSRKRIVTPDDDNFGFAAWVYDNAEALVAVLGEGLHFGEWWGSGIQRGYGLPKGEKRFSLFDTKRWWGGWSGLEDVVPGLGVVPVLYEGPFDARTGIGPYRHAMRPWESVLDELQVLGSKAAPGFMRPEGIIIYHHAARQMFKVTLEGDEAPKTLAA